MHRTPEAQAGTDADAVGQSQAGQYAQPHADRGSHLTPEWHCRCEARWVRTMSREHPRTPHPRPEYHAELQHCLSQTPPHLALIERARLPDIAKFASANSTNHTSASRKKAPGKGERDTSQQAPVNTKRVSLQTDPAVGEMGSSRQAKSREGVQSSQIQERGGTSSKSVPEAG